MYFECWECVWYLYQSLCCHNYTWIYGRICRWKNLCAAVAAKSQLLGKHQIRGCRWEGRAKCFGLNSWILEGLRVRGIAVNRLEGSVGSSWLCCVCEDAQVIQSPGILFALSFQLTMAGVMSSSPWPAVAFWLWFHIQHRLNVCRMLTELQGEFCWNKLNARKFKKKVARTSFLKHSCKIKVREALFY